MISKCRTPFRQKNPLAASENNLLSGESHILRGQELPLLDIDDLAGFPGCLEKVRLPAEKSGNLKNIHNFGSLRGFFGRVDIGQNRYVESALDLGQDRERLFDTNGRKCAGACAVRFFVGRFENQGDPTTLGDANDPLCCSQQRFSALHNTRPCDQDERMIPADSYVTNLDDQAFPFIGGSFPSASMQRTYEKLPQQSKNDVQRPSLLLLAYCRIFSARTISFCMKVRAYAKINIGLHILGKRPDGYHNIETVFRLIDVYDELEFLQNDEGIVFTSDEPQLGDDPANLCVRAARLLRDLTGIHIGVEINLKKHIPLGSGLGGGSSNAAAVLKGLTKLWALEISNEELQTISGTLGSDVPFFFTSQTAYATGRGERLTSFNLHVPYWILVVTPDIHVSTAWAYSNVIIRQGQARPNLRSLLEASIGDPAAMRAHLVNDFEETTFKEFPMIAEIKERMLKDGAEIAQMSGSGSSVYGFFSSQAKAKRLESELSGKYFTAITEPEFVPEIN